MGESLLTFYRQNVKKEWRCAFYTAFVVCLLVHFYKFTNTLPNHDSFYNVYSDQNATISGRWFLTYACGISSYFDLPWINGLLCAVYLGFTAAIVAELFELKNPVVIALSAAVLAAFPSTTETLFFEFTADGYLMGLALSALAACISCKGKKWWHLVLAGLCLCLSCAIYQAYVSFAVVLCICYLILRLLNHEITVRDSWKWIGKHVLIYGAALATYYAVWKLILTVTEQSAVNYQGIDTVGMVSFSTIIGGLVKSFSNLFFFFLEWNIFEHPITLYGALNIVFLLCFAAVLIVALVKSASHKDLPRLMMVLFCLAASIPMISVWCFLSEGVEYRPMMLHSVLVYYIFALILFDKWVKPKISTVFGLFMVVVIFNSAVMANISYFYLDKCYEKSFYLGSQMMDDIDEMVQKSYDEVDAIVFVGNREAEVDISKTEPGCHIHILSIQLEEDFLYDHTHTYLYLQDIFGLEINSVPVEYRDVIAQNPMVQNMPAWPAEGSLQMVDGVLVIKLADSAE